MYLTKKELSNISGGVISGTYLNALTKLLKEIFEIGKSIGYNIRTTLWSCRG